MATIENEYTVRALPGTQELYVIVNPGDNAHGFGLRRLSIDRVEVIPDSGEIITLFPEQVEALLGPVFTDWWCSL